MIVLIIYLQLTYYQNYLGIKKPNHLSIIGSFTAN